MHTENIQCQVTHNIWPPVHPHNTHIYCFYYNLNKEHICVLFTTSVTPFSTQKTKLKYFFKRPCVHSMYIILTYQRWIDCFPAQGAVAPVVSPSLQLAAGP